MCAVSVTLSVLQSVRHAAQLGFIMQGSFGAAFAKSFWPFVLSGIKQNESSKITWIEQYHCLNGKT